MTHANTHTHTHTHTHTNNEKRTNCIIDTSLQHPHEKHTLQDGQLNMVVLRGPMKMECKAHVRMMPSDKCPMRYARNVAVAGDEDDHDQKANARIVENVNSSPYWDHRVVVELTVDLDGTIEDPVEIVVTYDSVAEENWIKTTLVKSKHIRAVSSASDKKRKKTQPKPTKRDKEKSKSKKHQKKRKRDNPDGEAQQQKRKRETQQKKRKRDNDAGEATPGKKKRKKIVVDDAADCDDDIDVDEEDDFNYDDHGIYKDEAWLPKPQADELWQDMMGEEEIDIGGPATFNEGSSSSSSSGSDSEEPQTKKAKTTAESTSTDTEEPKAEQIPRSDSESGEPQAKKSDSDSTSADTDDPKAPQSKSSSSGSESEEPDPKAAKSKQTLN
jgi:hypothetical protein